MDRQAAFRCCSALGTLLPSLPDWRLRRNGIITYLLATAAEDAAETFEGTEKAVQGWVDCFPRCTLAGTVFAGGVNEVGDIAGRPALDQAYQMGSDI